MEDLLTEAANAGLISHEDIRRVQPEQVWVLKMIMDLLAKDEFNSPDVCELDVELYSMEVAELNDIVELDECDRVEPDKSFKNEEVAIEIPSSLIPFMREFVLPEIRRVLTHGS